MELSRDPGLCNVENLTSAQWHQLGLRESPGCAKEVFHGKQERVSPLALASPRAHLEGISHDFQLPPGRRQKKKKKAECLHTCGMSALPRYSTWFKALGWVGTPGINVLSKSPQALQPLPRSLWVRSCVCARKPGVCGLDSVLIQLSQPECFPEECGGGWNSINAAGFGNPSSDKSRHIL